jgi:CheY-like chemotaxis protein
VIFAPDDSQEFCPDMWDAYPIQDIFKFCGNAFESLGEVVDYLSGTGEFDDRKRHPPPSVIFLDLKLPLKSGHEVLSWIRRQEQFKSVVVVVLTSSDMPTDIKISYQLGANSYLVKPPTAQQLLDLAKAFKCYWLEHNQFEDSNAGG